MNSIPFTTTSMIQAISLAMLFICFIMVAVRANMVERLLRKEILSQRNLVDALQANIDAKDELVAALRSQIKSQSNLLEFMHGRTIVT